MRFMIILYKIRYVPLVYKMSNIVYCTKWADVQICVTVSKEFCLNIRFKMSTFWWVNTPWCQFLINFGNGLQVWNTLWSGLAGFCLWPSLLAPWVGKIWWHPISWVSACNSISFHNRCDSLYLNGHFSFSLWDMVNVQEGWITVVPLWVRACSWNNVGVGSLADNALARHNFDLSLNP